MKFLSQIAAVLYKCFFFRPNIYSVCFSNSRPAGVNTLNPVGHFQIKEDTWFDINARILLKIIQQIMVAEDFQG